MTTEPKPSSLQAEKDAFLERLIGSLGGAFDLYAGYLGVRLGLYEALAREHSRTSAELAAATGTDERYVREWLEQQAVTGILEVAEAHENGERRRYRLPPARAEVLTDRESLDCFAPLFRLFVGAAGPVRRLVDAFQSGEGIPYGDYGEDLIAGQAAVNRATFLGPLGREWLPAIPDLHARLGAEPPARVADVGCGAGWSGIGMARAYPRITVHGFDLDPASVELAQANVREAGLEDRVQIERRDAGDPALEGRYDLVTAFESVHDLADPVGVLATMRRLAGEDGTVLVVDERVGERFEATPPEDSVDWMMYGWSVLHCLPAGRSETPSAATGTVMRPPTLRRYAREAGFSDVETVPVDHYFFRLYRLRNGIVRRG